MTAVSIVVPVHNGEALIRKTVAAILAQRAPGPVEVILVDDHSQDGSAAIVAELANDARIQIMPGPGRGAAAAINAGVRAARHALIGQVDQDVMLQPGWIERLVEELNDPSVGAAQGYYVSASDAGLFGRVMNRDLELRYTRDPRFRDRSRVYGERHVPRERAARCLQPV